MEYKRILLDRLNFAATTQDLNIPADHVKYLDMGLECHQCGTTACVLAGIDALIDEIRVQLGGEWIMNIHTVDLLVLNQIWEDITPVYMAGAGDNQHCLLNGVRLPLHVTKYGKSLSCRFTYAANACIIPCALSVAYQYREQPFQSHFNIQYREANATVAQQEINLDYAGAECIGVLLFATTIVGAGAAVLTRSIEQVRILSDDREVYNENWDTMTKLHGPSYTADDANYGGLSDHYRWLDFQQEPLPAGKLRMLTNSSVSVDAIRVVPVYIQKNQAQ